MIDRAEFIRRCKRDIRRCATEAARETMAGYVINALVWQTKVPTLQEFIAQASLLVHDEDVVCLDGHRERVMTTLPSREERAYVNALASGMSFEVKAGETYGAIKAEVDRACEKVGLNPGSPNTAVLRDRLAQELKEKAGQFFDRQMFAGVDLAEDRTNDRSLAGAIKAEVDRALQRLTTRDGEVHHLPILDALSDVRKRYVANGKRLRYDVYETIGTGEVHPRAHGKLRNDRLLIVESAEDHGEIIPLRSTYITAQEFRGWARHFLRDYNPRYGVADPHDPMLERLFHRDRSHAIHPTRMQRRRAKNDDERTTPASPSSPTLDPEIVDRLWRGQK